MKTSIITFAAIALSQLFSFTTAAEEEETIIDVIKSVEDCTRKAKAGDYISVHYKGTFEDGKVFDSSYDRGNPLPFILGRQQVIKCWDEGLLGMCVGEIRELTCQPDVAYGKYGIGPIPGDTTLVFTAEMVSIENFDAEPESEYEKDEL
ncbi:FPR2 FK506-binding protein 2 [Candida maltosa Xu316]